MGAGVPRSAELALPFYLRGCDLGSPMGCNNAGVLTRSGEGLGGAANLALSRSLFERACEQGYWVGCEGLGRALLAIGGPGAVERAVAAFGRGCIGGGEPLSCVALAEHLERVGDLSSAAEHYRGACNEGDAVACFGFARLVVDGRGVELDLVAARQLLDYACGARIGGACAMLAGMYAEGVGVDVDSGYASIFYRRACEAGHAPACAAPGAALDAEGSALE